MDLLDVAAESAEAVAQLRFLAERGMVAQVARTAAPAERALLSGAAFTLAWPIVYNRLTRGYEQRRGHRVCATAVNRLADGCLDRFYDDVEAVTEDFLTHADTSIRSIEGWMTARLRAATVDAHRRRRGARGALQRPRLPGWLAGELGHDPWLTALAVEILVWAGIPATAGTHLWPLDDWAERRLHVTGEVSGSDARTVEREVHEVLEVMRLRPKWYADYVERPLGAKRAPLAPVRAGAETVDLPPLMLTEQHELDDNRLGELAALALRAFETQLATDPEDETALARIITVLFGRIDAAGDALVGDPADLGRIVAAARDILGGGQSRDVHLQQGFPLVEQERQALG